MILNDAVKDCHPIDVASRTETERRLVAEIPRCWSYASTSGQLRVFSMPLATLEARQPGARQTRRMSTTWTVKLLLPRVEAHRVLLRGKPTRE